MSDDMRCTTEYREMISAYIDGDLEAAERDRLLSHIATCDECRQTLESYRRIGGYLRSMPRAVPPPDLRDAIYAETVHSNSRKVYLLSSRLGYSVAAIAAVVLIFIVAVYLLVSGYQRSLDPEVVASQPGNGILWPLSNPVEITFNKEMDEESVEAALSIVPASEKDRLSTSWEGNTLILGQNQTLQPASSYTIRITTSAQDKWGQNLGSEFRLQFETSETFALQTPEPLPTPTSEPTATPTTPPTEPPQPTPTEANDAPAPVQPSRTPTAESAEPTDSPAAPTPTEDDSNPAPQPTTDGGNEPIQPTSPPAPTATAVFVPPTPTDEPEPEPSPTPTTRPTSTPAPTWTPRPVPSATPTDPPAPTATPTDPAATATPDSIPVVGAFGNVYWANEIVSSRLGSPTAAAYGVSAIELDFQHGAMISRSDTGQTYVLESATGIWSVLPSSSDSTNSETGPIADTWIPGGSLGALWSAESWIQASLGYALAPSGTVFDSRAQRFENGTMMLSASGQVYVIYDSDGTWELYPDPGS